MNRESLSSPLRRQRVASFTAVFAVTFFLLIIEIYTDHGFVESSRLLSQQKSSNTAIAQNIRTVSLITHRKLLNDAGEKQGKGKGKDSHENGVEPNRIWSESCSKSDIQISQGPTEPLPNGIPTYRVEIMNICISGCNISAIHLRCGWFSSARLVNPQVFKRLRFDDCLVNDGKTLVNGRTLSFQYANTFRYPLSVSSVGC